MPKMYVLTARDVPTALILRRGPSAWFHLILWDTLRDDFTHGAWFRGMIYWEKCDLSPDGHLFVYSAFKGNYHPTDAAFGGAYTAVSRPPWLFSLGVCHHDTTYGGGGRFVSNTELRASILVPDPSRPGGRDNEIRSLKFVKSDLPVHHSSDEVANTDWCGRDQKDRVIYTRAGQLFRRIKHSDQVVADFTEFTPDPQPCPKWATVPVR